MDNFVPALVDRLRRGDPVTVWRGAERRWVFVRDFVDAVWAVTERGSGGEYYDVGGDRLAPIDIAQLVVATLGSRSPLLLEDPPTAAAPMAAVPPGVRAVTDLGWSPGVDPPSGFALTALSAVEGAATRRRPDRPVPVAARA